MAKSIRLRLRNVRCVWPKLFVAEEYRGQRKYSVGLLIEKDSENYKQLQECIREAVASQFGNQDVEARIRKFKQTGVTKFPVKPFGDDDNMVLITPKLAEAKGHPRVFDQAKKIIPPEQESRIRAGYWLNASVDVFCHNKEGGGICFYLNGVQLVKEDAVLSGSGSETCDSDFEALADTGVNEAGDEDFL